MLERFFHLKENKTTVRTELIAGLTTFMTMAYILAVNPSILGKAGMSPGGVLIATALAAFFGSIFMALFANYPFALAPGMGLNAYFTYTVVLTNGYDFRVALLAVFIEGLIFIVLSLTNVREAIFNAIPTTLKHAVSVGIGLFIAFIGLQGAHLVRPSQATIITYVDFRGTIHTSGITALLAILGVIIIAVLSYRKVKGSILFGILATWILGMIMQAVGVYVPDVEKGFYSLYPTFSLPDFKGFGQIFGSVFTAPVKEIHILEFIGIVFAFLFVDIFDTLGTLMGVASKTDMLDKDGRLPNIKGALLADAIATSIGAVLGTSTTTTYVESSAGVAEGGRTGLTAATVAVLFLVSIILSPIFVAIPAFATAPALIYVGYLMVSSMLKIDFSDLTESIPAFICILVMPLFYSISEGIAFGTISYVVINLICGKKKKISLLMFILAIIFVCKYIFLN